MKARIEVIKNKVTERNAMLGYLIMVIDVVYVVAYVNVF
jgi:hypothetical protein